MQLLQLALLLLDHRLAVLALAFYALLVLHQLLDLFLELVLLLGQTRDLTETRLWQRGGNVVNIDIYCAFIELQLLLLLFFTLFTNFN